MVTGCTSGTNLLFLAAKKQIQQDGRSNVQLTYITDPSFADINQPCESGAPNQVCAPRKALPETTLYVPLQFWFCRNPGLALPLIALQYHEVKVTVEMRPLDECLWSVSNLTCVENQQGSVKYAASYQNSLVAASLYVDYVFLDTDERRRMAQNPHEYLIEQLQFTGGESVGSSSNKIKLSFNHPCKELVWVVQKDDNVDYCASFECQKVLFKALGAQPFNYTDAVDALPNAIHAFGGPSAMRGVNEVITTEGLFDDAGADTSAGSANWGYSQPNMANNDGSNVSDAGSFVLAETALNMHCWGENPVVAANFNSTVKTASLNVKAHTLTLYNHSNTIPVPPTPVLTYTHSLFAPKNTNHLAHATSPESTTHPSKWYSPTQLSLVFPPHKFVYTQPTTMSSVLCQEWAGSHTQINFS